jgi:serine/threonine-protein kinase
MSRVFLAEDRTLGRNVVVKTLSPELVADISTERFAREIKLSARLQHPQVVPLLSAGEAGGLTYYIMPYVEGEGLRERITREGKLPIRDVVSILRDVAKALAFAHSKNVVHRDIKPENILLSGDSAVVADFGIAKAIGAARADGEGVRSATLTSLGTSVGTPAYMSPEQASGDPNTDQLSDIYSFGCVGYEILTGHPPFVKDSVHRLIAAHISETPKAVELLRPDCPRPLAILITRCLEKDPANRPQSAIEILSALDGVNVTQSGNFSAYTSGRKIPIALAAVIVLALGLFGLSQFRAGARVSPAIAILPFKNVGGDTTGAYFGEGLAQELALTLQRLPGVQVASQTSAAAVQEKRMTVQEIGAALGVGSVLEGSVRRDGGHIHLNATLSNASDGRVIWADEFDRDAKQLFEVQNDLAKSIANALSLRLTDAAQPSRIRGTDNPAAYDLYLRGRHAMTQGYHDAAAVPTAVTFFEEAVGRDSTYARAYSGYADALSLLPFFNKVSFDSVIPLMIPAARRAIALDANLGEAHASLGRAYGYQNLRDSAEREYKIAIKLDPNYASAEQWLGSLLCGEGRVTECLPHSRRAAELDPLNTAFAQYYANSLVLVGELAQADSAINRALQLDSGVLQAPVARQVLIDLGRYEDVVNAAKRFHRPFGEAVYALVKLGRRAEADSVARVGLQLLASRQGAGLGPLSDEVISGIALGDTGRALSALDRERGKFIRYPGRSLSDPLFDPIRGSARFASYVVRLGLDPKILAAGKGGRP